MNNNWSVQQSRTLYNVAYWSDGFFDIDDHGFVIARPNGPNSDSTICLMALSKQIKQAGLTPPVLVRFTEILKHRFLKLKHAFAQTIQACSYEGSFLGVYPIKVNQQHHIVEKIVQLGGGLEAGSKPELLAVLALARPGSVIICNGYKDREYIRLALISQRLGHHTYIILEKCSELDLALSEAKDMGISPRLGIRMRMASQVTSKWQNTGGEKSKFGFSVAETLLVIEKLKIQGQIHLLQLLHFHLGSQITNISDVQRAMSECARHYSQLRALAVPIDTIDVGGGLAIDYEGTRSRSLFSMNYSVQEYAKSIVYALKEICQKEDLPHPNIITESGRAIVAHHALLIVNVINIEKKGQDHHLSPVTKHDKTILRQLWDAYQHISERSASEVYHHVCHRIREARGMYNVGLIDLAERARAEEIYTATCVKARKLLKHSVRTHREALDELNENLADKLFCNFSLFQSLPDTWAIDQVFPIMPLSGLTQEPTTRAVLHDITCDSDGKIENYIDGEGIETTLPLPPYDPQNPYLIGIFLVGAYQETLGDMHNLFGDTHSVHVTLSKDTQYTLEYPIAGDSVAKVLSYVHFDSLELLESYQAQLARAKLTPLESKHYFSILKQSLKGHTYLKAL